MKAPTLDEFIIKAKDRGVKNSWVIEPKFESLYVRYIDKYIKTDEDLKVYRSVLDIANVTVKEEYRGTGVFTALIKRLRKEYPAIHIHVENAHSDRFQAHLRKLGFIPTSVPDCLFLPAKISDS